MKIFGFIRRQKVSSHKFGNYLLYAIGEIILLVVGILIALQVNNWNAKKVFQRQANDTYEQIKRQILADFKEVSDVQALNQYYTRQFELASSMISRRNPASIDTLAFFAMQLSQYTDFNGNGNMYESLVNNGDIKLIDNKKVANELQRLEMTYTYMNKLEDIHWEVIMKELSPTLKGVIRYADMQVMQPEKLYSVELQNIFIESFYLTKGKDSIYERALNEMEAIIKIIDAELEQEDK